MASFPWTFFVLTESIKITPQPAERWRTLEDFMKKQLAGGLGLLLVAALGVVLLVPSWRIVLSGLLRNEHFFAARPTSFWSQALNHPPDQPSDEFAALKQ